MHLNRFTKQTWVRLYSAARESFLSGTSSTYLEEMYNAWKQNPKSVHVSWDAYFRATEKGSSSPYQSPPNLGVTKPNEYPLSMFTGEGAISASGSATAAAPSSYKDFLQQYYIQILVKSYQMRGHLAAELDPLSLEFGSQATFYERHGQPAQLVVRNYLAPLLEDMNKQFFIPPTTYIATPQEKSLPLKEILLRLERVYCRTLAPEFMHIVSQEVTDFIKKNLEPPGVIVLEDKKKKLILKRLIRCTAFENFLAKKWSSEKRFGLEGCDMVVPALKAIIDKSVEQGVDSIILGMPHRGRLNVLANVCRKPLDQIFNQFASLTPVDEGSGDVKYHLGISNEILNRQANKTIHLSICANPSHLEAVDPVVMGKCRAEQFYKNDKDGNKVMPILIHGDAAFAGQGVVYETINFANLPLYSTRGTIHVVANNQIGFTTNPKVGRSSMYCTDVAKVIDAPVFHVNADDPEMLIYACELAANYRAKFKKDVVIDIVGYRRFGHNEIDEPSFTQPFMYQKVKRRKPITDLYAQKLVKEKIVTQDEVNEMKAEFEKVCEDAFARAKTQTTMKYQDWLDSHWSGFFANKDPHESRPTGVDEATLAQIGMLMSSPPPADLKYIVHRGLDRVLKTRQEFIQDRQVDWALAEGLAFGTLLKEKIHVRLTGQDVERGTFSHRHHILHNQEIADQQYCPLSHISPDQAEYTIGNSNLSEYAVMGFELGYSIANPNALVLWEAQFGDFNNTAQCVIDQFIASGQTKWVRQSGLVLLLPHGMEGMGPEHSSARLERFLQLSEEDEEVFPPEDTNSHIKQIYSCNWIVVNCTTPANYFHTLRRQIYLNFRKPLIIMTPKSLLRLPQARSSFDDMNEGTEFKRVIFENGEASSNPSEVKKLIFCTGKVYYELVSEREAQGLESKVAISRLEQISPFPFDLIKKECDKYDRAELIWAQEEHKNQGAWSYVQPRIVTVVGQSRRITYIGRAPSASPATGSKVQHLKELVFLKEAISIEN